MFIAGVAARCRSSSAVTNRLAAVFTFEDIQPSKCYPFIENRKKLGQMENSLINGIKFEFRAGALDNLMLMVPMNRVNQVKPNLDYLDLYFNKLAKILDARSKLLNEIERLLNRLPLDSTIDCSKEYNSWIRTTNDENGMREVENSLDNWAREQEDLRRQIRMSLCELNNLEFGDLESE